VGSVSNTGDELLSLLYTSNANAKANTSLLALELYAPYHASSEVSSKTIGKIRSLCAMPRLFSWMKFLPGLQASPHAQSPSPYP